MECGKEILLSKGERAGRVYNLGRAQLQMKYSLGGMDSFFVGNNGRSTLTRFDIAFESIIRGSVWKAVNIRSQAVADWLETQDSELWWWAGAPAKDRAVMHDSIYMMMVLQWS